MSSSSTVSAPVAIRGFVIEGQIQQMTDILTRNPENASAYVARGGMRLKLCDQEAAMADFDQAILLAPRDKKVILAYFHRAQHHEETRQHRLAADDIIIAKAIVDGNNEGITPKTRQDVEVAFARILSDRDRAMSRVILASGGCGETPGEASRTEKGYHEMIERGLIDPTEGGMALRHQFGNDIKEYLKHCFEKMNIAENDYAMRFLRVKGMMAQQQYGKAIEELHAIIEANPHDICRVNPDIYFVRSMAYYGVGNLENAIKDIWCAIDRSNDFALYHIIHYRYLLETGEIDRAFGAILLAYKIDPKGFMQYAHYVEEIHLVRIKAHADSHKHFGSKGDSD